MPDETPEIDEDQEADHEVPVDMVELHEVLEWDAAVTEAGPKVDR